MDREGAVNGDHGLLDALKNHFLEYRLIMTNNKTITTTPTTVQSHIPPPSQTFMPFMCPLDCSIMEFPFCRYWRTFRCRWLSDYELGYAPNGASLGILNRTRGRAFDGGFDLPEQV
jgi:hypothetical protein